MLDSFGRNITYMRISITDRCNMRCRYCMPEKDVCEKTPKELLSEEETVTAIRAAASLGITKLRFTGGEPLMKKNILPLCREVSAIPGIREVCVTTNGTMLPALAKPLRDAGVSRVNISLDTLDALRFRSITRGGELSRTVDGIRAALEAGFEKIKLNTVLIGGFNDDEIPALAELTRRYPLDLRFIELMPMLEGHDFGPEAFLPCSIVPERLPELSPVEPDGGLAKLYQLPGGMGRVGLISPLSDNFCADCSRIRLTADGKLKPCLHAADEYSLKGLDYDGMLEVLRNAILCKPSWHGTLDAENHSRAGRTMNQIGG